MNAWEERAVTATGKLTVMNYTSKNLILYYILAFAFVMPTLINWSMLNAI